MELEDNNLYLAYTLSIAAEDLYKKGYYTSALDKYSRVKNYYINSKKELSKKNNKYINKIIATDIDLLIQNIENSINKIKFKQNSKISNIIPEYLIYSKQLTNPILLKMESNIKELSLAATDLSNVKAIDINAENIELKKRIAEFQSLFLIKTQLLTSCLHTLEQPTTITNNNNSNTNNLNTNMDNSGLEQKQNDSIDKLEIQKLEKKINMLTKQLESESALREKQTVIIDQLKQRVKLLKDMVSSNGAPKKESFPSTASK